MLQIHRSIIDFDERAVGVAYEALRKGEFDIGSERRQDSDGVANSIMFVMG